MNRWPATLPASPAIEVERIDKSIDFEADNGDDFVTNVWDLPKWRYTLRYEALRQDIAAPAPYEAYSQVGAILHLVDQARGSWGKLEFMEPTNNQVVVVRFEKDSLKLKRDQTGLWWSCEFSFRTTQS